MSDESIWHSTDEPRIELRLKSFRQAGRQWQQPVLIQGNGIAGAVICAETVGGILMLSTFRPVIRRRVLELPRGWTDRSDEDGDETQWAVRTAVRECIEETGSPLTGARFIGWLWADTALLSSKVGVIHGQVAHIDLPEDPETNELVVVARNQLAHMIENQHIADGLSLGALAMCHQL